MVRRFLTVIISAFAFVAGMAFSTFAFAEDSCKCEPVECGPCENLVGTTFYTDTCEGGKTKSCQKPKCELKPRLPQGCEHLAPKSAEVSEYKTEQAPVELVNVKESNKLVGTFFLVRGEVSLIKQGNREEKARVGSDVHEKDIIVTGQSGQAKVIFLDKNTLNVAPESKVRLKGFEFADVTGYSSSTIDLVYGKLRAKVVTKPKFPDKPHFLIRTPAAVAGVRGTDFVVSHKKDGDISKVETLHGTVELKGHGRDEKTLIRQGQYGSYVVLAGTEINKVFDSEDISNFVHKGFLTPVFTLTDAQAEKINIETDYQEDGSDRIVAAAKVESPICSRPSGNLNQCVWRCVGNPSGESHCRTDLKAVKCVRQRCDANGRWAEDERLPASSHMKCNGSEDVVGTCDY